MMVLRRLVALVSLACACALAQAAAVPGHVEQSVPQARLAVKERR